MRKLTLDVDALRVESFDTHEVDAHGGTVRGLSYPNQCDPPSDSLDPQLDTCQYATCAGSTCWPSCNATCNHCGGTGGCQQYSVAFTYCEKDPSCINECDPTLWC
jgi:hypothetical protein